MDIIKIDSLNKNFYVSGKEVRVLSDIKMNLPSGSITGLLGPNGAGKTTLLKIISTLISPSSGKISIKNYDYYHDSREIRKITGLVLNPERSFYAQLTVEQNLLFFASLFNISRSRIYELSEKLRLGDYLKLKFHFCSTGIRQKISVIRALLHNPEILLIDELTKSIDFFSKQELEEFIKKLSVENSTTSIFVSHDLNEIEKLADYIILINKGRIISSGSLKELKEKHKSASLEDIYRKLCV